MAIIEASSKEDFMRLVKELVVETMRQDKYFVLIDELGYVHVIPKKTSRHLHIITFYAGNEAEKVAEEVEKLLARKPVRAAQVTYGKD